jgi:hypothetical protein
VTSDEIIIAVIDALELCRIPYMAVGSVSLNLYTAPRSTQDADFVVELQPDSLPRLMQRLGPTFRLDAQVRFETVTATTRHIIDTENDFFRVELFQLSDDPYDRECFSRRRRVTVLGHDAYAATPEDVIVMKLRWSRQGQRSKDKDDARNVIAAQVENLDWDYIHRWCDEHGTRELLDEIRRSIPKT